MNWAKSGTPRHSNDSIDEQIRQEIMRVARDVIEWKKDVNSSRDTILHWKPRSNAEKFIRDGESRLIPTNRQVYYDLQLSRGAARPTAPDSEWHFDSPEEGVGKFEKRNTERLKHLQRFMRISKQARILELGSRSGQLLYYLRSRGFRNLSGIDVVRLNVLWCQKNGFDVRLADAHELLKHYQQGSFDSVFAYHILEHCYDPEKVLWEIHGVLSRNGSLHIEIPIGEANIRYAHVYGFRREELRRMLIRVGFKVLDSIFSPKNTFERVIASKQSLAIPSLITARMRSIIGI